MSSSKQPYQFTSHPVKLQRGSLCGGRKPRPGKAESAASLRKWSQATNSRFFVRHERRRPVAAPHASASHRGSSFSCSAFSNRALGISCRQKGLKAGGLVLAGVIESSAHVLVMPYRPFPIFSLGCNASWSEAHSRCVVAKALGSSDASMTPSISVAVRCASV